MRSLTKIGMLIMTVALLSFPLHTYAQVDYQKWGRIAVEVAKENYAGAEISEYQYMGREEISATEARDTFKLQVKEDQQTFNINVYVLFNPQTNRLISVSIEELRK